MSQTAWLARRAVLALLFMVSFYALALAVAAILLWIPYAMYAGEVSFPGRAKFTLFFLASAGMILWSILPRRDPFRAPGPELGATDAPDLFAVLTEVAKVTGQAMPAHVYLVNDVNAFVAERGGIMGIGARRVMGIGLPLLQSLTVQELKAVLAHEFGHYHGGDVSIGPWIYQTRAAIGRTVERLQDNFLQKIFVVYGRFFLRITHAVSRRQELIADEVAARAAGAAAMASALGKVHGAAGAFHAYWRDDVGPLLAVGYLPPVVSGFAKFVQVPSNSARIAESIRLGKKDGHSDPFDTHPSLRDRITALQALEQRASGDTRPALSLLGDPSPWERRLLAAATSDGRPLTPVRWDEVAVTVHVPMWRAAVARQRKLLEGVSLTRPPFAARLPAPGAEPGYAQHAALRQFHVVSTAIVLALVDAGWTPVISPGETLMLRRDGHTLRPFDELYNVGVGATPAEQWAARCAQLGIEGLKLGGETQAIGANESPVQPPVDRSTSVRRRRMSGL